MSETQRWRRAGEPLPTSAIRVDTGQCAYGCGNQADYLVKAETVDGRTAKTRVCEDCNQENDIMAERYLPDGGSTADSRQTGNEMGGE